MSNAFRAVITTVIILGWCLHMGCSTGSSPVVPEAANDNLETEDLLQADTSTSTQGHQLLGIFSISFDPLTEKGTVVPNREAMAHYNVTPFLLPPHCDDCFSIEIEDAWPEQRRMELRVKIKNPFHITGYDVRGILMHNQQGWDIEDNNGYTSLFDDGGQVTINPFVVFLGWGDCEFPPGNTSSKLFTVVYPEEPDFAGVGFVVEGSWPGHCEDVRSIRCEPDSVAVDCDGTEVQLEARASDYQHDILSITLDATDIGGSIMEFEEVVSYKWEGDFFLPGTSGGAEPGLHRLLVTAESNSPILTYTYVDVFLNPLPPPMDVTPEYLDFGRWRFVCNDGCLITYLGGYFVDLFDIAAPQKPRWASFEQYNFDLEHTSNSQVLTVVDDRLYIVDLPGQQRLYVVDISNIYEPQLVGSIDGFSPWMSPARVTRYNSCLYIPTASGFCVVDISTLPLPTIMGEVETASEIYGMTAHNDYLYFEEGIGPALTMFIAELTDPANPQVVAEVDLPIGPCQQYIGVDNNLFAFEKFISHCNLHSLSIASPTQPEFIGTIDIPVGGSSFCIRDGYAYIPGGEDGIAVVDIQNPEDMELVGLVQTEGQAGHIEPGDGVIYVGESRPGGLTTFDISDPENPIQVYRIETFDTTGQLALLGDYACVVDQSWPSTNGAWSFLRILDINIPERARIIQNVDIDGWIWDLTMDGKFCYILKRKSSGFYTKYYLDIVSLVDPEDAYVVISVGGFAWCHPYCIAVGNGYAFLGGNKGLVVIDVDPPEDAYVMAVFTQIHHVCDLASRGTNIYLLTEDNLLVYDVSVPDVPLKLGEMSFANNGGTIIVRGNYAYIGTEDGIYVVDIADPSAMEITDQAHIAFASTRLHIMGGFLFAGGSQDGVGIFKIFPPGTIEPAFNLDLPYGLSARYVACRDGYMFVTTGSLRIYKWW